MYVHVYIYMPHSHKPDLTLPRRDKALFTYPFHMEIYVYTHMYVYGHDYIHAACIYTYVHTYTDI